MATQDETILLHFDIDEGPAVQSIKDLRSANSQLRAERDKVNISTKEGKDLVEKLNVAIDKNNKVIKDNSSALEKQRTNVGNYSKSIQDAAGNLNIMGTNVGGLATKLTSFVNPATAAVAIVGALGAAYAQSTIGARDLAFVQNQLGAALTIVTNEFAAMISSAEDGEGALTGLFNAALNALGPAGIALATQSKGVALAKEVIEDLNRDEIIARGVINERLADNQELMTKIQDSQTDYNEKVHLAGDIIGNLRKNEEELLAIKNEQLRSIDRQLAGDSTNEKLLDQRAIKLQEISAIQKDTERKVSGIQKLESNLLDVENKRVDAIKKQNAELRAQKDIQDAKDRAAAAARELELNSATFDDDPTISPLGGDDFLNNQFDKDKAIIDATLGLTKTAEDEKRAELLRTNALKDQLLEYDKARNEQIAAGASNLAGIIAGIAKDGSDAQKGFALTSIALNSAIGVSGAVAAGAGKPWPENLVAILSGIAAVLSGIAQARELLGGAAAGGGDFVTSKPTLLMVGDNPGGRERVTVEPLSGRGKTSVNPRSGLLQMAGGGSLTVNPRMGDGGFVANSNLQASQQAMVMANALRNLPAPVVSVVEISEVQKRVQTKERVTRQ